MELFAKIASGFDFEMFNCCCDTFSLNFVTNVVKVSAKSLNIWLIV